MIYNIEEKLSKAVSLLKEMMIYQEEKQLEVTYLEVIGHQNHLPSSIKDFKKFDAPYLLYEKNKYYWFHTSFEIGEYSDYQKAYLSIQSHLHEWASTRPQGLLYLNNELIQGVDVNHIDVLVKEGKYEMFLLFYTHEFSSPFPLTFSYKFVDKRVESLYFDLSTILESIQLLDKNDERYLNQLDVINHALNLIDYRKKDSELFYSSIKAASQYLKDNYFSKLCGKEDHIINYVAHSHIDVAWLWDYQQTREKVQRTFSSALKLMDEYREYSYFHTTPQVFEFLKEDNPILFNKVKEKIKEGRFEVDGAMWVEADCNLTSGESLVRQLIYGQEYFEKEFNVKCSSLFLPDVFGYSSQLPQLLTKCGIKRFVTAKIGWNDTNRFPYDSFSWVGLDGSSVFTYLISTCAANPRSGIKDTTYTSYVSMVYASQVLGVWNRYQNKDINTLTFSTYGYGDGGGGPTREMIERIKRFSYGLPGLGKARFSSFKETLDEIENNIEKSKKEGKEIPSWNGELYFEYHRGTYTSVPLIKFLNRKTENALQTAEITSSFIKSALNEKYPKELLKKDWKKLLINQFHDVLPGSSVNKVYLDAEKMLNEVNDDTDKINDSFISLLSSNISTNKNYVIFNPNSFSLIAPIKIEGKTYYVSDIPSFGYKDFSLQHKECKVKRNDHLLENDFIKVIFDDFGNIVSLFDKVNNKEFVNKGEKINELICYEDIPYQYDNWELAPYYLEKKYPFIEKAIFEEEDDGERKGFKITRKYFSSTIIQKVYLNSYNNIIDISNHIIWKEKRQVLKVNFATSLKSKNARYETQFGNIVRPTIPINKWEEAKFEVSGQKWVDIYDDEYGLGIINNGKYGYSASKNEIAMTILKSGGYPYEGASDNVPDFIYSLIPHKKDFIYGKVAEYATILNRPLLVKKIVPQINKGKLPSNMSMFSIDKEGVFIDTLKEGENDNSLILRMYEGYGKEKDIILSSFLCLDKVYLADLKENEEKALIVNNKNEVSLHIKPFEVITLKIN